MAQTIAGALVGGALGAYGDPLEEVKRKRIDSTQSQADAIAGNLLNFEEASNLTSMTNSANQSELNRLMELQLPGGSQIIKDNILADLQEKLTPGELSNLTQALAERGVNRGTSIGGGSNFDLGDAALSRFTAGMKKAERGFNSALQWMQASLAPRMGVQSMFKSPAQVFAEQQSESDKQYAVDLLNMQIRSAPDPNMVALAEGFDNFFKTWSSIGTGMAGGMGGGGAGGGAGGMASFGGGGMSGGSGNSSWTNGVLSENEKTFGRGFGNWPQYDDNMNRIK